LGEDAHADVPTPASYECEYGVPFLTQPEVKPDRVLPGRCSSDDPSTPIPERLECRTWGDGRRVERELPDPGSYDGAVPDSGNSPVRGEHFYRQSQ
jgi:hypothetical protein